jgi:formate hydrogenlyase subunit 6/NADH:ubiquinone oxidoreductase subunit I
VRSPPTLRLLSMALGRGMSTIDWPREVLVNDFPERGVPCFDKASCTSCGDCLDVCPAACLTLEEDGVPRVDAGPCVRCGLCGIACGEGAVSLTGTRDIAAYSREDLVVDGAVAPVAPLGPAPSRLYRTSVDGQDRTQVEASRLLDERAAVLLRKKAGPKGQV